MENETIKLARLSYEQACQQAKRDWQDYLSKQQSPPSLQQAWQTWQAWHRVCVQYNKAYEVMQDLDIAIKEAQDITELLRQQKKKENCLINFLITG